MWNKYFVRDNFLLGLILGIALPAVSLLFLCLLDLAVVKVFETHMLHKQAYLVLLSIVVNLFAIKYYFVNLQYDKTGRGVLLVTFLLVLKYFIFPWPF